MNSNHLEPIEPERIDYLLRQQKLYQAAKPELLGQYQGQYIAFENGVVLDSDLDDRQLMPRLYAKYGHRDILVEYVCDPEPQLSVSAAGHLFPVKFRAYACSLVDLNGHAIIGRDVLNQCLVEFDDLVGEVRL